MQPVFSQKCSRPFYHDAKRQLYNPAQTNYFVFMEIYIPHVLSALVVLGLGTLVGYGPTRKLISVREARHELAQGSASQIRGIAGWIIIAFWLAAVWFCGTVIGDWAVTLDLEGAIDRSFVRLRILIEILAALADD